MVESNFLSPTMQGDIRPAENRAVPNPLGPLNAGPGVEELLPAVNPGVASQAPRERGLGGQQEGPRFSDTLAAVGSIVDGVGGLLSVGASFGKSEEEKKDEALRPLVERFNTIKSGMEQGSITGGIAMANAEARTFFANYPTLATDVKSLYGSIFGVDLGFGETVDPDASYRDQFNKWKVTEPGRAAVVMSRTYATPEAQGAFLAEMYEKDTLNAATLYRMSQELATVEGAEARKLASDRIAAQEIVPRLLEESRHYVLGRFQDLPTGAFDLEAVNQLRQERAARALTYGAQLQGASIDPSLHEKYLAEALTPFDTAITLAENNATDLNRLVEFDKNQNTQRFQTLVNQLDDPFMQALMGTPDGARAAIETLIVTNQKDLMVAAENLKRLAKVGGDPTDDNGLPDPTAADLFKKGYLDYFRQNREAANVAYKDGVTILSAANILEEAGMGNSIVALRNMMASSIATDSAISLDSFSRGYVQNIDKINLLLSEPDEISDGLSRQLNAFTQDQLMRHRTVFADSAKALPSGFFLEYDGSNVTLGFDPETFERADNDLTNRVKFLLKQKGLAPTVENIGNVISNARGIIRDTLNTPQGLLSDADPATQGPLQNQRRDAVYGNLKTAWDSMNQSLTTINTITQFALDVPNIAENYEEGLEEILEDQTNAANFVGGLTTQEADAVKKRIDSIPRFATETEALSALANGTITPDTQIFIEELGAYGDLQGQLEETQ